jgi:pimeloyl-ACP methyl ester carboxylesterase
VAASAAEKSTIVRANSRRRAEIRRRAARRRRAAAQLAVVRARLAVLQRVAPRRAARLALALWCTPPSGGSRHDNRSVPGVLSTVTTDSGASVVVETWVPDVGARPEAGIVYLVHGWGGWRGQLGAFVEPLVAEGYRVVTFDAPSHGDSGHGTLGPRRSTMPEMADALAAVVRAHGDAAAVVAHSLATATTVLAVRDGLPTARLVLVAAIDDVLGEIDTFGDALGLTRRTRDLLRGLVADVAARPLGDLDVRDTLRTHAVPPALVVHDRADPRLSFAVGAALAADWPEGELLATDGLGHHRVLRDPDVVRAVVDYVAPVRAVMQPRP